MARNVARETAKAAKAGAKVMGVQDDKFGVFTLESVLALLVAQLGRLATIDFPDSGGQLRFLGSDGQWRYINLDGAAGAAAAEFGSINGKVSDNPALLAALGAKLDATNSAMKGKPTAPTADHLTVKDDQIATTLFAFSVAEMAAAALLDDLTASTRKTWSSRTIDRKISEAAAKVKDEITGGAGAAFDTLKELETRFNAYPTETAAIVAALGARVRFDADQSLTEGQKAQALKNLGLANILTSLGRLLPEGGILGDTIVRTATGYAWKTPTTSGTPSPAPPAPSPPAPSPPAPSPPAPAPQPDTSAADELSYQQLEAQARALTAKVVDYLSRLPVESQDDADEIEYLSLEAQAKALTAKINDYLQRLAAANN